VFGPHLGVHAVVRLLAFDPLREPRDISIRRVEHDVNSDAVRSLVEPVARDRPGPVSDQGQLDKRRTQVLVGIPVEGERVRVGSELLRRELVPGARMADLGLGDRREGDILFEEGRDARPLGVPPAQHQLVVSEP